MNRGSFGCQFILKPVQNGCSVIIKHVSMNDDAVFVGAAPKEIHNKSSLFKCLAV